MMDLDAARDALLDALTPVTETETVPLAHALGRVLAEDVHARSDVPPFPNSAMDGYAVRADDPALAAGAPLVVVDRSLAGRPARRAVGAGETVRIFTGAVLPDGADAVIAQEDATPLDADRVRLAPTARPGRFVRGAGGDVRRGEVVAARGTRVDARRLGLLAAAGVAALPVRRPLRVAVVTTGDELRDASATLAPGEIHDAGRYLLPALLRALPVHTVGPFHAPDDPGTLEQVLARAAGEADVIVSLGGVSVGEADHVRELLERRGRVEFWSLAVKPGKPFTFGAFAGRPFLGLPGNPVSACVTFLLLARPALERLAGAAVTEPLAVPARLAAPVRKTPGRRDFQRGRLAPAPDGTLRVRAFERQDSNVLSTLADADCLLDLPRDAGDLPAEATVRVLPLAGLLAGG